MDESKQFFSGSSTGEQAASPIRIAVFASGTGTNAANIIRHFSNSPIASVSLVVSNKVDAGVLRVAENAGIPTLIIEKERFFRGDAFLDELKERNIELIALAGFLWKIPSVLIAHYPRRIINIHPALLPKYGGRGMYGQHVHAAVVEAGEQESGITIHFVDEHYDHGDIILQVKCPVLPGDTPGLLAERVHALEYANYPVVIEELAKKLRAGPAAFQTPKREPPL